MYQVCQLETFTGGIIIFWVLLLFIFWPYSLHSVYQPFVLKSLLIHLYVYAFIKLAVAICVAVLSSRLFISPSFNAVIKCDILNDTLNAFHCCYISVTYKTIYIMFSCMLGGTHFLATIF